MMRLSNLWVDGAPPSVLTPALVPLAHAYALGARVKPWAYRVFHAHSLDRTPVIAVGNITMGGAGKTPAVVWLAERLTAAGFTVAIVTRGYPGFGVGMARARRSVRVVCDGSGVVGGPLMGPEEAGDEPYLVATLLPRTPLVIAGGRRYRAARLAEEAFAPDVLLLDDGYQHIQLARAATLLVVDGSRDLSRERGFPAGRLREPLSALRRADAVLVNKSDGADAATRAGTARVLDRYLSDTPRFEGRYALKPLRPCPAVSMAAPAQATPAPTAVFAFAGIENPQYFLHLLAARYAVAGKLWFPDHYAYDRQDMRALDAAAREEGATVLVTTAKDAARLMRPEVCDETCHDRLPVCIADIELRVTQDEALLQWAVNAITTYE